METGKEVTKVDALPTSFEEISGLAKAFVASGMFQDTKQLSQAIVKIQAGRELGLPPVYSMQNINMIRDRLTSSANTMAMLIKRSGRYDYRIKEHTNKVCAITFYQREENKWAEIGVSTFSMDDAEIAKLVKPDSGWTKFPRAMLFSRAISQGARIYAPDAIGGMYTDEEIRSIPPRPNDIEATVGESEAPMPEATKPPASPLPAKVPGTQKVQDDAVKVRQAPPASKPVSRTKSLPAELERDIKTLAPKVTGYQREHLIPYLDELSGNLGSESITSAYHKLTEEQQVEFTAQVAADVKLV